MLPIVKIISEVFKDLRTGSRTVGTTAVQVTTENVETSTGVLIVASSTNTGIVYVGTVGVTADTDANKDGIPVTPGSTARVYLDNANKVYVIASAANQKIFWGVENNF